MTSKYAPEAGILLLAGALLFVALDSVPGVHGDEAWILYQVEAISGGHRSLHGMTVYTGALHQWLAWPVLEIFGYSVTTLRGLSAALNLITVALAMGLVRMLRPTDNTHRRAGLVLATFPTFIIFSRFGVEVLALSPVLVIGGLFLLARGRRCGSTVGADGAQAARNTEALYALAGGALLGLATYNHVANIIMPAALVAGLLAATQLRFLRWRATWFGGAGFALGWLPQVTVLLSEEASAAMTDQGLSGARLAERLADLAHLPSLVSRLADGSITYTRFVGENLVVVVPYVQVLLVVGLIWAAMRVGRAHLTRSDWGVAVALTRVATVSAIVAWLTRADRGVAVGCILAWILAVIIAPMPSLRFLVLPLYLGLPYAVARISGRLPRVGGAVLLALLVACNVAYLSVNYYASFSRSGGRVANFAVGNRLIESSGTFTRTEQLYTELVSADVEWVVTTPLNALSLAAHDFEDRALKFDILFQHEVPSPQRLAEHGPGTAVIYHAEPIVHPFSGETYAPDWGAEVVAGDVVLAQDNAFDDHFIVHRVHHRADYTPPRTP